MSLKLKKSIACLVDGEHYLPNTKATLETLSQEYDIQYIIFIGGTEKIGNTEDIQAGFTYPVYFAYTSHGPDVNIMKGILESHKVDMVFDLSDEPVVNYKKRFEMACVILFCGMIYKGSDFEFLPLQFDEILTKPSLAIWGTGKRIGKTAFGGFVGRLLKNRNKKPAIVTLSRGGPPEPMLVRGDEINIDVDYLLSIHKQGLHASSDCFEDALMARIPTFGCRRCGGGMTGKAVISFAQTGAMMAEESSFVETVILEGSGASIPEIKTDGVILLMDITQSTEILESYLTPLKILYADIVVLTMCEDFFVSDRKIDRIIRHIKRINKKVRIATTVLRPLPLKSIKGKKVFWATTAPSHVVSFLKHYIEDVYECSVVASSSHLSHQEKLRKDMQNSHEFECVLTELKASAVSVVAKEVENKEIVFLDNEFHIVDRGGDIKDLESAIVNCLEKKA